MQVNPATENTVGIADSVTLIHRESQHVGVRVTKVQLPYLRTRLKFCLLSKRYLLMSRLFWTWKRSVLEPGNSACCNMPAQKPLANQPESRGAEFVFSALGHLMPVSSFPSSGSQEVLRKQTLKQACQCPLVLRKGSRRNQQGREEAGQGRRSPGRMWVPAKSRSCGGLWSINDTLGSVPLKDTKGGFPCPALVGHSYARPPGDCDSSGTFGTLHVQAQGLQ